MSLLYIHLLVQYLCKEWSWCIYTMVYVESKAVQEGILNCMTICDTWYWSPVEYHVYTVSCSHIATYYVPLYSTHNI